jgi:hypothetical protein
MVFGTADTAPRKLPMEITRARRFVASLVTGAVVAWGGAAVVPQSSAAGTPEVAAAVMAGVDRVVILGGKTYLTGKSPESAGKAGAPATVAWSKVSGPGTVTFADAHAPVTTAAFSAVGDYLLKLAADKEPASQSSTLMVRVIAPPPETRLEPVEPLIHTINSRFWNGRVKAQIVNWIPHCINKLNDPKLKEGGIHFFIAAANKLAGKPPGEPPGPVAVDAWTYNVLESICLALMIDPQGDAEIVAARKAMLATLDDWIPKILAAQEPDGYLQTTFTLSGRERWSPEHRSDHEGYVAGYFLDAAVAHYLMTDKKDARLYNAAKKLADCWYNNLGPAPKKPWYDGHQAMEMALLRFGQLVSQTEGAGKGDKYIALAKFLLDCRRDGQELDQSHLPVIRQYEAVGHAVRATYSYAAMAGVAMETGDVDYQSAVTSVWNNLVHRKYYVTGGIGTGESPEGFGPDYSLPQQSYCEACASCGEMFFQHQMHMMCQDAKYADLYEESLYNAVLGSIDLEGKNFYYRNLLNSKWARYPWHACPCCVGNISRTLLMLPTWMYGKSSDSIYVNLFIGSTVTVRNVAGTHVGMVQVTDYPWSDKVSITVNPAVAKTFSIRIRVPNRSVSDLYAGTPEADGITAIAVNGSTITPPMEKGYAVIARNWQTGDKIDVVLPMTIQRVKGIDKIAATRGRVALRYGPLIYNVERLDQDLENMLSPQSSLSTEWRGDFLDGVMVINGTWVNGSKLLAIPHYARENRPLDTSKDRSVVRSAVWLKDQ